MPSSKGNIRRRENKWQVNWLDGAGKRRWKTFRLKKTAEQFLRQAQVEADGVRAGLAHAVDTSRTWEDLLSLWQDVKHRKRTLGDDFIRARKHLTPVVTGMRLGDINATVISRIERRASKIVKVGTVRQIMGLLRAMLRLAVEHGWLLTAPKVRLPKEAEHDYQWIKSRADIDRLIAVASEDETPGLDVFYATALFTGMRAGELCGLCWDAVDLDLRLITVRRSFKETTKSGAIRRVPILDPLLPLLRRWRLESPSGQIVFPNLRGNMHVAGARVMKQTYHRCLESAGIQRLRFHSLRHTFASHWVLGGGDLYRLQRILGHTTVAMTQRYAHLMPDAYRQDWGRLGGQLPKGSALTVEVDVWSAEGG